MATASLKTYTPQDLLDMPDGDRYELVRGRLVKRATTVETIWTLGRIDLQLDYGNGLGKFGSAYNDRAAYRCFPFDSDRVRRPNASFIRKGRIEYQPDTGGHCPIAPDLVIEVVTRSDRFNDVEERIQDFHAAGTSLVWIVSPQRRFVRIHRIDGTITQLKETDELTGEDIIPGFRCRVADLFPPRDNAGVL